MRKRTSSSVGYSSRLPGFVGGAVIRSVRRASALSCLSLSFVFFHVGSEDAVAQYRPGLKKYDAQGRLAAEANERGELWSFVYQAAGSRQVWFGGREVALEKADGTVEAYAYDSQGRKTHTRITRKGAAPRYIDHQPPQRIGAPPPAPEPRPAATAEHARAIDLSGNVYARDALARLTSVTTAHGTTHYRYFEGVDAPLIAAVTNPGGSTERFDLETARAAYEALATPTTITRASLPSGVAPEGLCSSSGNRFAFGGYRYECELGLYYTPSGRMYDPQAGRFTGQDSYLGKTDDPPSLHRYLYANANPLRYVDPTGHEGANAGCYYGPSSCPGQQRDNITFADVKRGATRAAGSVVGTAKWAGRTAWTFVNLAMGRGSLMDRHPPADLRAFHDANAQFAVDTVNDPRGAPGRIKAGVARGYNQSLDRAQARMAAGDEFGAGVGFQEEFVAPMTATAVGAVEGGGGLVRGGTRLVRGLSRSSGRGANSTVLMDEAASQEGAGAPSGVVVESDDPGHIQLEPAIRSPAAGDMSGDAMSPSDATPNSEATELKPGQVASAYPRDRRVGGRGEGVRDTDPPAGTQESGAFDLTPDNLARMEKGKPPIGQDGLPVELHHRDQNPAGPLDEMSSKTHDAVSHPVSPSQIDRGRFAGERARYWRERARALLGQGQDQNESH